MSKLLLQNPDKRLPHLMHIIILIKRQPLLITSVPPHGAHIDHPIPKLDEGTPLDGDVQVRDVVQAEVGELLPAVLAELLDEGVGRQLLAQLVRRQAVLREAEVEEGGDGDAGGLAELLFLFYQVAAADEADGAFLAEGGEGFEGFGGGFLLRQRVSLGCFENRVEADVRVGRE
jgi:hypothetical protein